MRPFAEIFGRAGERKGGAAALRQIVATTSSRTQTEIAAIPDDRILGEIRRRAFYAPFSPR